MTWKKYQEEAALFFQSLGLCAKTDVTVRGVRTSHDIDVLVKSRHLGFEITWLVECKHWKTRVTKLHVLALREIVADVGADRGILLCEAGFQSGAIEAAHLTNVQITSLAEVSATASSDIYSMRMRDLYERTERCNDRYWDISKEQRIQYGLRPDVGDLSYSGTNAIDVSRDILSRAFRELYPITPQVLAAFSFPELPIKQLLSPRDVCAVLEPIINHLEKKLDDCEARTPL